MIFLNGCDVNANRALHFCADFFSEIALEMKRSTCSNVGADVRNDLSDGVRVIDS